jgi:TolB protein
MDCSLATITALFAMHNLLRLLALALAMTSLNAFAVQDLGDVVISADLKTIAVRVSGSPAEIDNLAKQAFNAHGRYRLAATGGAFDIKFTQVAAAQVQVVVVKRGSSVSVEMDGSAIKSQGASSGSGVVLSQVVSGTSSRNALFRAADLAVKATSGLKGFFSNRLTFISTYSGHQEVFTSDLFFGEVKQITRDNAQAITPRWAPDGRKILYTSFYKSGFPDIFLIDLNSLQRTLFVSVKGTNSGARFSPDASQVAMVLSGEGNPEIYVSNAQGRQIARRTRSASVEASPCWSPDGSKLLFTSDAAGGPQLYVMPAGGGSIQRIPTAISRYCAEPDWSKGDPTKIAFTVRVGSGYQVAVYDLSGKMPTKIVSKAAGDAVEPSWLGDGRHVVYTARAANSRSLTILDTETGKTTRISPPAMREVSQASVWAP